MSDPHDIAAFLAAMDEPEMATEVLTMHNRLEAFASGVDGDAFEAMRKAFDDVLTHKQRLVKALREINEWTSRYTTPGHPINTACGKALADVGEQP